MKTEMLRREDNQSISISYEYDGEREDAGARYLSLRGFLRLLVIGLIMIGAIYLAIQILIYTGVFKIREIEVMGNEMMSDDEVVEILDIEPGMSISAVDEDELLHKINENSRIADVEVSNSLSGVVTVHIEERNVVGLVSLKGELHPITSDGYVVMPVDNVNEGNLPFITGVKFAKNGEFFSVKEEDMLGVLKKLGVVKQEMPRLYDRFGMVEVGERRIRTLDGLDIFFDAEAGLEMFRKLESIYAYSLQNDIESLDIRYDFGIVGKLRVVEDNETSDENRGEQL